MVQWLIPIETMVEAVQQTVDVTKGKPGIDNWGEKECTTCRDFLPVKYRHIETDILRNYAGNIRRNPEKYGYKSPLSKAMGRKGYEKPKGKYAEYLKSEHWLAFRLEVLTFWEYDCCLCKRKADDVHHNTYQRKWQEKLTDCVALCSDCHKRFHFVLPDGNEHFEHSEDSLFAGQEDY